MRDALWGLWEWWKAIAVRIGHFQTRVVLSVLYYLLMSPVALGVRVFADPLGRRIGAGGTRWQGRDHPALSFEQARRQ